MSLLVFTLLLILVSAILFIYFKLIEKYGK